MPISAVRGTNQVALSGQRAGARLGFLVRWMGLAVATDGSRPRRPCKLCIHASRVHDHNGGPNSNWTCAGQARASRGGDVLMPTEFGVQTLGEETLFDVVGFCKRFGRVNALTDVSFRVRTGEVLGLIGPNGAGKSTLFECLAGTMPCDAGEVRAAGRKVQPHQRPSLLFYVPDGISPWASLRVRWVLEYAIGFFDGRAALRDDLVRQLDLAGVLNRSLGTLSKGERKRVLLAIGLLTSQPALLIDEPFDGLDLRQSREAATILRTHAASGRTLFLSIHQIDDAARFCDRFVLLSGGRVCGEGTVPELGEMAVARYPSGSYASLEEVFLALT